MLDACIIVQYVNITTGQFYLSFLHINEEFMLNFQILAFTIF